MDNTTIIIRRPTTDEETVIGMELNCITDITNRLLRALLETEYRKRDPKRFGALFQLHKTMLDAEADFFGFMSWDDLTKWQKTHGSIFGKIEL